MADTREGQIFLYFSALTLLIYLAAPTGYLLDIPTAFLLKNQIHATATQVSTFRLVSALPAYLAFAFGLLRDQWNPLGLRDRGYFLVFAPLTGLVFAWLAFSEVSYRKLLIGTLLVMMSFRLILAAYQGLMALIGEEKLMSGRLSTVWNAGQWLFTALGAFASGFITEHLTPKLMFLVLAALVLLIGGLGFWQPRGVFAQAYDRPEARRSSFAADVRRLTKHRAVYPVALIFLLSNFLPGANTPLQFYLTDRLHLSDAAYSWYTGTYFAALLPPILLYGFLCRKVAMRKLLWWAGIIGVPGMIPLMFIRSTQSAIVAAVVEGLLSGMAAVAFGDLAIRSCPPGLQGTLMMLLDGMMWVAMRGGDVVGSWLYGMSAMRGFLYCVIAMTTGYALILPVIALVPKDITATADGERSKS
jgi:MFS family permease